MKDGWNGKPSTRHIFSWSNSDNIVICSAPNCHRCWATAGNPKIMNSHPVATSLQTFLWILKSSIIICYYLVILSNFVLVTFLELLGVMLMPVILVAGAFNALMLLYISTRAICQRVTNQSYKQTVPQTKKKAGKWLISEHVHPG